LRSAVLSPFVMLLLGLGIVLVVIGDARGWVTVAAMIALSVGLRWWQQLRSDRGMRVLRSKATTTATVRRRATSEHPGVEREVPLDDVVPGDVVILSPGDVVPADVRL